MRGDPYWLTTRRRDACAVCGEPIEAGERVFYYPRERRALCDHDDCGGQASRDFEAARFDEAFLAGD